MNDKFKYRLSQNEKSVIAQNLIDILRTDAAIIDQTRKFITNWILTGPEEKTKAFFDVWDVILRNYLPTTRPILFRACARDIKKETISSFTGRLECARRFSQGRGFLIICDTKEILNQEESYYNIGEYRHTFYPLVSVLKRARDSGGCGFSERFLNDYIGEDEYIMRTNVGSSYSLKWVTKD